MVMPISKNMTELNDDIFRSIIKYQELQFCVFSKMRFFNSSRGFSSMMVDRRARVLLVGSGRMGHIRSSLLYANPRFDLAGVVDIDLGAAASLASAYQTTPFKTLQQALEETKSVIDGIVVSSPTFTHEEVIRTAANYGINVFTEKPVDETAEKIASLYNVAERAGIKLCCGFQRRFDASYSAATEAIKKGKIGAPITANIFFADHPCPPKEFLISGGNIFMDLSAHDIDYITHAFDDKITSVYATGTSSTSELEAEGVHDNANMIMTFSKGAVVHLFMSRSATYGYDQRCEIFGDKGLLSVQNEYANSTILADDSGVRVSRLKHSFPQRFQQAFGSEMDAFADTLLDNKEWPILAEDCIRVQKVADAARISCATKEVVQVKYDDITSSSSSSSSNL